MSIQEKIRFGKITIVAVAVAMVVMMFIPFFYVWTPYNGDYDVNAIELLLDYWYVFDASGQVYCVGMIVIMAIVFPLVMLLPVVGSKEKLDRKRMEQGLNPKAERALDKLLVRRNVWYMLISAIGLVFGLISMVPAITYVIGDLMGVYVNDKYDLKGCGLVLVIWLLLSVPGLIYNVMASKLFGYDREEIKLRRRMREKGIYTKEALEADARGEAVVTPPEYQQPVQQQYVPHQQPMQPPYGQYQQPVQQQYVPYQQPMQPPYGQYQQPMQPPYGQYQQPMQPPYGQYQQPMQPPYGQYQQSMQPPYGQYQQPMQPPYGQQQQPTQPQPPTPSDQDREE